MGLNRRNGNRFSANIWPGFVDAMTALLLVLMFVLTIFMVVQFVLRDTITGQDIELNNLSQEIGALSTALGLERNRADTLQGNVDQLNAALEDVQAKAATQATLIASLSAERDSQQAQIANFEQQVASLLARNTDLSAKVAKTLEENEQLVADKESLEAANQTVISEQEALRLALAKAREEIDAGAEAARLAAAKREAMEALIADLKAEAAGKESSLADALALLASTQQDLNAAQSELSEKSLSEEQLQARLDDLAAGLSEAEKAKLAEAAAAAALRERLESAEDELTAMTLSLEAERKKAEDTLTLLAAAQAGKADAETLANQNLTEAEKQAALLAIAQQKLSEQEQQNLESQRKVALLNEQTQALRQQLDELQGVLDAANAADEASQVQIESLGANLNTALARVAAEQKKLAEETQRRIALEEAERKRLEAEANDLKKFKSEFFGRLRDVLGNRDGVRIVGDRFVFSSEILFGAGSADLGERGKAEIAKVARIIRDVAGQIPSEIDWVLRVDGHTDKIPLSGFGEYRDNWELSQARALSVVKYLIAEQGIPANRLAANGFGEFQPIVEGDDPNALAQNRRIELKFTEK